MACKFTVTIDYPDGKNHNQYLSWFEETIGSDKFAILTYRLSDENELDTSGDRKSIRVDNGYNVIQTNYYRYETHASAMHTDLTILLQSLGEYLVISDIETITEAEYTSIET